jgi:hypothetical protein
MGEMTRLMFHKVISIWVRGMEGAKSDVCSSCLGNLVAEMLFLLIYV